ncbi:MAG: hypothetical protein ACHQUC_04500 [Chlamydiales bacterium]
MIDCILFFGFPIDVAFQEALEKVPSAILNLFIQIGDEYLKRIDQEGISYLGKSLGQCVDSSTIDLAQGHILSLLKRLVPDYPYNQEALVLLAISAHEPILVKI